MNRPKKLCVLLGILAAACVATFAVMHAEERREQIKNSGETILALAGQEVQSLSWDYENTSLAFHRDGTWLYDGDETFPVSEERINGLLEPFEDFAAAFVIEDAEDFGQYGLEDPICTIRLSTAEEAYEVKLGDYSKMDAQRYVSIGDGNVYLMKHDPLEEFDAVLSDMIAHDEIPSFNHVTAIRFSGAEASSSITYAENSADTYSADDVYFVRRNGRNLPLDTSKVEGYLRSLSYLGLSDYVTYHATEEELRSCGLDAPERTVTVEYTEEEDGAETAKTFVLHVSPDPEEVGAAEAAAGENGETEISAYVRVGESPIVYRISSGDYERLAAASYDDLRHSEVLWADFADIERIDVTLEGECCTLTSEEDGGGRVWFYQDAEIETDDLRNALEALTAVEFTAGRPVQKEEIRLTVHLDNENFPEVEIMLYRYDGERCLAEVDGESVSLVERAAVVSLIEAVHAIVLD